DGTATGTLHAQGKPGDVTVGQSIPAGRLFGQPLHGTARNKDEPWVARLENASAEPFRMSKGYEGFSDGGGPDEARAKLTGGGRQSEHTASHDLHDPTQRQELLDLLSGANVNPTTATTPKRPWYKEMTDLVGNHAYTVLGTYKDKSGRDMVRI